MLALESIIVSRIRFLIFGLSLGQCSRLELTWLCPRAKVSQDRPLVTGRSTITKKLSQCIYEQFFTEFIAFFQRHMMLYLNN